MAGAQYATRACQQTKNAPIPPSLYTLPIISKTPRGSFLESSVTTTSCVIILVVMTSNGAVNSAPHPPAKAPMTASESNVLLSKSISGLFDI